MLIFLLKPSQDKAFSHQVEANDSFADLTSMYLKTLPIAACGLPGDLPDYSFSQSGDQAAQVCHASDLP